MQKPSSTNYFDIYPSYKGGHTTTYGGYIYELCPHHPLANRWGFVAQHRLVAEDLLLRPLVQHPDSKIRECVHHKDENKKNNNPDNLEVLSFSEHRSHHTRKRNLEYFAPRLPSRTQVTAALLSTPTIKAAAAIVGVCHQTLRAHFPDLVAPYARRKATNPYSPSTAQLDQIRTLAADPKIGEREAAKTLGLSGKTVRKVCSLFGIPWVRKSRKGGLKRTHGGQPTPRYLALCAKQIAPD